MEQKKRVRRSPEESVEYYKAQLEKAKKKVKEQKKREVEKERRKRVHRFCSAAGVIEQVLKEQTGKDFVLDDNSARKMAVVYAQQLKQKSETVWIEEEGEL